MKLLISSITSAWCTDYCNVNGISARYYLFIIYYLLFIVDIPGCVLADVDHCEQGGEGELPDHRHLHQSELSIHSINQSQLSILSINQSQLSIVLSVWVFYSLSPVTR